MTKKDQALAAVNSTNAVAAFKEAERGIRFARDGLAAFEGEELTALREAYAEAWLPALRLYMAELQRFVQAVDPSDRTAATS